MTIQEMLFDLQDKDYAKFQHKLAPTVSEDKFIGVRMPKLRSLCKKLIENNQVGDFLDQLPHLYHDENLLHSLLISEIKDFDVCIKEVNKFLPYIDNWAVCDSLSPKVFNKNKDKLIGYIKKRTESDQTYTIRFGVKILMEHFLDEDFKEEFLKIPEKIHSDEYYVQMGIAWFYSTALIKQWDATIPYIEKSRLDKPIHNMTIQKARDSRRIGNDRKEYLKTLKNR